MRTTPADGLRTNVPALHRALGAPCILPKAAAECTGEHTGEHTGVHEAHSQYTGMALSSIPGALACLGGVFSAMLASDFLQNRVPAKAKFTSILYPND